MLFRADGFHNPVVRGSAWAWLVLLVASVVFVLTRPTPHALLTDTDTRAIIRGIEGQSSPLQWFVGDWPLGNHFYRPVSTLPFQWDVAVHGESEAGWSLTNAMLCVAATWALMWLGMEAGLGAAVSLGAGLLFMLWHRDYTTTDLWLVAPVAALGVLLPTRLKGWKFVALALVALFLYNEVHGITGLQLAMLGWIPGRTASMMAIWAFGSLAMYLRSCRLECPWWGSLSLVALVLALGSYEQAVVLPGLFSATYLLCRWRKQTASLMPMVGSWMLLIGYIALRAAVLPGGSSAYQQQQMRTGGFSGTDFSSYLVPCWHSILEIKSALALDPVIWLNAAPWIAVLSVVAFIGAVRFAAQSTEKLLLLFLFLASCAVYLPMAWLKTFEHYHYAPMGFRALFLALLAAELRKASQRWTPPSRFKA